jgi:hypothetical protein
MPLDNLIARPITGIRPFNELPIDAEIWHEAHEHHHHHRQLHSIGVHRPGIAYGLDVVATGSRTVAVAPGVGIDSEGQTIVLSEPVYFTMAEKGQFYITLSFLRTADRNSGVTVGGGVQYYRVVEGRDLKATQEVPRNAYLELARIYRSEADSPVRNAANRFDPAADELNLLHRQWAFPHCYADASIGELPYVPLGDVHAWKPNRAGLWHLVREGNGSGFHLDFSGPLNLRAATEIALPTLLYMAGAHGFQPLSDAEISGLNHFLSTGGLLMGEAVGGSAEFQQSFDELARRVGAELRPIKAEHPLLSSHHVFAGAPRGAAEGTLSLDETRNVMLSTADYGAAWRGAVPHNKDSRDRIREAHEFGLNIVAYAAAQRRRYELSRELEGI